MILLQKILHSPGFNKTGVHLQPVAEDAVYGFKHQNPDIRNVSFSILQELYRFMGTKLKSYLSGLR